MVSLGGALGALLVGIAAPDLLHGYFELGIALVACAALLAVRAFPLRWWVGLGLGRSPGGDSTLAAIRTCGTTGTTRA